MKKKIYIVIVALIMIIGVISSSYAYLKAEKASTNSNNLTLSNFGVVLLTDIENINMNNSYPMEDSEGLLNTPTTFEIKNTSTVNASYKVSLVDKENVPSTMSNSDVRYRLKKTSSVSGETETLEITNLSDSGLINEGNISPNEVITYELVLWIDYNANPNGLTFSKTVLVEGMQVASLDTSGANYPEMSENMIPVYYDKISDTEGVWRIADSKNLNENFKWFDYEEFMWANAVTVREEGKVIADKTGNVKLLSSDNSTILSDDTVSFDGLDDYLKLGYENYNFGNKLSVVVRFKLNTIKEWQTFVSNAEAAGFSLEIQTPSSLVAFSVHQGNVYKQVSYTANFQTGVWYTLVAVYDGTDLNLYFNGSLVATSPAGSDITPSTQPITIAANPSQIVNIGENHLGGVVSDAFVYKDALNNTEISTYFKDEITSYPNDNLLIAFDEFKESNDDNKRDLYLNSNAGTPVSMEDITTMWVWIPRYKYTIFTGLNEPSEEQLIDIEFEHGIDSTGTITCVDNILTASDSASSETCTDETYGSIIKGKSTYTHPAFTFGSEELTGFWMAKFEMSTDDATCINSKNATNCNKIGLNTLIKPSVDALSYQSVSTEFVNIRRMELTDNIHGFPQGKNVVSHLDSNSYLTGNLANDSNKLDIHMQKNMEWGAVAYLSQSRYGKWNNSLYSGDSRRVYKNNYYTTNDVYKTGYSSGKYNGSYSTSTSSTFIYNDMTITAEGQGYRGAGASTTGTIYGVYDMNGGLYDYVMGNMVNSSGNFYPSSAGTWSTSTSGNIPNVKYYDKYSYNSSSYSSLSQTRGKLGDATKETTITFGSKTGDWGGGYSHMPYSSYSWFVRGGVANHSNFGVLVSVYDAGNVGYGNGSRPVLVVSRELPWVN